MRALPVGSTVCGPPIRFGPQGGGIVGYTPAFPGGFGEPFSVAARAVRRGEPGPG